LYSTVNKVNKLKNKPQQHQQLIQPNSIRSKTPGPDVIYFRDEPNKEMEHELNMSGRYTQHRDQLITPIVSHRSVNHTNCNYVGRSKTPTAEMMYYPTPNNNTDTLTKRKNTVLNNNQKDYFNHNSSQLQMDNKQLLDEIGEVYCDAEGNYYIEMVVDLLRQESGFGFKIVGGEEEGSQVAVGYIFIYFFVIFI
jgi:hypothetical protein